MKTTHAYPPEAGEADEPLDGPFRSLLPQGH